MRIFTRGKSNLLPYSENVRRAEDCTKLILINPSLEQPDFVDKLFSSSLRYLAFEDGVYSFEKKQLLPYPVEGVYFTIKINRKFPSNVGPDVRQQLMDKVLVPIFPDREQLDYYLHRLSRALAGEVYDKKWHVCIGERNSGKVCCGTNSLHPLFTPISDWSLIEKTNCSLCNIHLTYDIIKFTHTNTGAFTQALE